LTCVAAERVAVQLFVRVVEGVGNRLREGLVDVPVRGGHAHLEGLSHVAQVSAALVAVVGRGETFAVERRAGAAGEVVEDLPDRGDVEVVMTGDGGLHVVVADVDSEQAEGGDVARVLRHQDALEPEDVDQPAEQQGARSAEGRHGEVANVEAALHGDLAQCVGLVPRRDLENASGALLDPEPESSCEVLETGTRGSDVQGDLATE
jgi:hypothetical protein